MFWRSFCQPCPPTQSALHGLFQKGLALTLLVVCAHQPTMDTSIALWTPLYTCPLLLLLARLLIIFHPPSFFLSLTHPAPLVAHKQKIYQNVRLILTRYAIIQFSRILIFRDESPIRNEWDEVKEVVNLRRYSNISCSGICSHRNTILALKCRHKSWVF